MTLNKPVESITQADLQVLIDNQVAEAKTIEYKQSLPKDTYDDKKEFLADVSSLANAAGGHLIFGIREEKGLPIEICGLNKIDADAELLRLENLMRDNVEPRIPGVSMSPVSLDTGGVAIVIRVPRSWVQPHVVNFKGHWRFYSRNSAGKYPLDVSEVRSAVTIAETATHRIHRFRTERIGKIIAGETPIPLEGTAKLVLHIVPMGSLDPTAQFDMSTLARGSGDLRPMYSSGWSYRHNFDGFLTYNPVSGSALARAYLQVFRSGSIEAVETLLLSREPDKPLHIPSVAYEKELLEAMPRFLRLQKGLGVAPPLFIMLSLLGVAGYIMGVSRQRFFHDSGGPIDRNDLIIPEIMIEDFECSPAEVLRPAFDAVWNATGWPRSMNYNDNGEWVGH